MAFTATPSFLGAQAFNIVHIDTVEVAKALQKYLEAGSKLTGVDLDDINTSVIKLPPTPATVTLAELLSFGMKLFDAIVWLTAGRPTSHPLKIDPAMTQSSIASAHEIARATFYCYFMLLVQARYPASAAAKEKPKIPNFLTTIMGMAEEQSRYVSTICSFEPSKFDPKWVKYISFAGFGQEALSRFGLGVAGYRLFGPFALYEPKPDVDPRLADAILFAKTVAKSPASWNVHPLLRSPNVLTKRGNLNKNLGNLILETFSATDIDEMVSSKVLYQKPTREAGHLQYRQWTAADDISGGDLIFPQI
jgi:hypothetical protein